MNYLQQVFKGKNGFERYLGSFFTILIGSQFIGFIPFFITVGLYCDSFEAFRAGAENNFIDIGINSNLYLFVMLLSFAIGLAFLFISIRYIHRRSIISLITSRKKIDWQRFLFSFLTIFIFSGVSIFISYYLSPEDFIWNFKPWPFFILILISFVMMPLQTSFEELFFRGYLMQGLGGLTKTKWIPLLITSVIFGLLHLANPEVQKLGPIIMIYYIGTGLFLGLLTLLDEGLELAMGFHAANNIIAAVLVTNSWSVFQTEALLIDTSEPTVDFQAFLPVFIVYPLLLLFFSKKYGWTNWKDKLFGKVIKP